MNRDALSFVLVAAALSASGCLPDLSQVFGSSASSNTGGGGPGGGGSTSTTTGGAGGAGGSGGATTGTTTSNTAGSGGGSTCDASPDGDLDGDGFSPNQGDCNDCEAGVNPNALELQGGPDENCDGSLDEKLPPCDDAIPLDSEISAQVVQVTDLCKSSAGDKDWGIIGAIWAAPDGSAPPAAADQLASFHLGHGALDDFGPNVKPRAGKKLLALSSGMARRPSDPGFGGAPAFDKGYSSPVAPGFPKENPSCPGVVTGLPNDATALAFSVRVPSNAYGFSYDFSFYAYDFPQFVCTQYSDTFFAILSPAVAGLPDGNIAYDELGNPITLNSANFRACGCPAGSPCTVGNKTYACPLGIMPLLGTGYDGTGNLGYHRGATGWLTTTVPVEPGGSTSLRWGVYDAGDSQAESTVLIDNWQWITTPGVTAETKVAQ